MSTATSTEPSTETQAPTAPAALRRFREGRVRDAIGVRGPASFVWGDFVLAPGTRVIGAPGTWGPLEDGRPGLRVTASADEGIVIDGAVVDGTAELFADEDAGPVLASFADGGEGVVFTYGDGRFALQVWNPRSEWASQYRGISAYAYDPSWVIDGTIADVTDGRTVAITHHRDPKPIERPVSAEITFERDGVRHTLLATTSRGELYVHFTDATSGAESYAAGRLVKPARDGHRVRIDFNYVHLLPCSFSLAWNCPLPAEENALAIPVRAGERHAIDAEGSPLL